MAFNSFTFLFFLALVLVAYRLPVSWGAKKVGLLVASYLFYAAWNPPFVLLLWISTAVDFLLARALGRTERKRARRALLFLSLLTNLGFLGFFKYGDFLLENFSALLALAGVEYKPVAFGLVLPMGISFYTFQSLSYTLDVYRGELRPWRSAVDFALYVSFFPQLVAGPIVRAREFLPQLGTPRQATPSQFGWGLALLTLGLFEKTVLADSILAPVADAVYAAPAPASFSDGWIGTLAFSAQIFFDFAGYSTCAIGVALLLGFALPDNFRSPYAAVGFADFWRRWHISLSSWLRDYLYIPLGGNRRGPTRAAINVSLTMLLGGLWHGASWCFVVWGALHGLYLVVERLLRSWFSGGAWLERWYVRIPLALTTYLLVSVTWVFFRASDLRGAYAMTTTLAGLSVSGKRIVGGDEALLVLGVTAGLVGSHWFLRERTLEGLWARCPAWVWTLVLSLLIATMALVPGGDRAFIYFQF